MYITRNAMNVTAIVEDLILHAIDDTEIANSENISADTVWEELHRTRMRVAIASGYPVIDCQYGTFVGRRQNARNTLSAQSMFNTAATN